MSSAGANGAMSGVQCLHRAVHINFATLCSVCVQCVHRARLEQTVQRLARITAAVDADQGRTSPLKTVEKVLLNRPSDDTENMGDQLNSNGDGCQVRCSKTAQHMPALSAWHRMATRRRLAKDLNAKIVYS
eukprot:1151886-Pelagomonas_calceolata.AAC.2